MISLFSRVVSSAVFSFVKSCLVSGVDFCIISIVVIWSFVGSCPLFYVDCMELSTVFVLFSANVVIFQCLMDNGHVVCSHCLPVYISLVRILDFRELLYLGNTLESKKENYERKTCFRLKPITYVAGNG